MDSFNVVTVLVSALVSACCAGVVSLLITFLQRPIPSLQIFSSKYIDSLERLFEEWEDLDWEELPADTTRVGFLPSIVNAGDGAAHSLQVVISLPGESEESVIRKYLPILRPGETWALFPGEENLRKTKSPTLYLLVSDLDKSFLKVRWKAQPVWRSRFVVSHIKFKSLLRSYSLPLPRANRMKLTFFRQLQDRPARIRRSSR